MIPRPVRIFGILENDSSILELLCCVAPNVEVSPPSSCRCSSRSPEPSVLIRSVVKNQLYDDTEIALVCFIYESLEIAHVAIDRLDAGIVGYVITIILQRRGEKREQPEGRNPQILKVIEFLGKACEVAHTVPPTV
jgi:hypothetical protein